VDTAAIERLARLRGIGDAYHDYRGELKFFSIETKQALLRAMACPIDVPADLERELRRLEAARERRFLPQIAATHASRIGIDINVAAREFGSMLIWNVNFEDGSRRDGAISTADCREIWRGEVEGSWITRRHFDLPLDLPAGYHEFEAKIAGGAADRCLFVVAPPQSFEPAAILGGRRLWGIAVQLYTLRSRGNWGIGDFGDLKILIRWVASRGAGFVGLNPLHALAPAAPDRSSPYSASSRHFLNVLYIAVPQVAEFQESTAAQARMTEQGVGERLRELRGREWVDYRGVAELKFEILALLHREFRARHLAEGSERARHFRDFVAAGGELLQMHALFDALDRHFCATFGLASGWTNWPEEFKDVHGSAAAQFAAAHSEEIEFFAYLQWLAHEQLREAQALARELGMPVGLYGDYAVGANPSGSEIWADRSSYCMGAEIGAPPDPLALKGQGWGIPPQDPLQMQAQRLQGFVRLIRNNMRYYGALRLDHVMALFRLWWVAAGFSPMEGAYVHYPLEQLLTVLALESSRSACLVVGEDLGVVPDEIRRAMPEFGLYHYKVLLFEKLDGRFRRPEEYVRRALATATTHDLPTLRSYWEARDIELRHRLQLYPSMEVESEVIRERERDRTLLLDALEAAGLRPVHPATPQDAFTAELAHAMHLYLARSATALVAVQIEDLLGETLPVNVPGTDRQYPNWQRRVAVDVEDLAERADIAALLEEIRAARG
jgi:4-alpha-glucanotransferase